MEFKDITSDEFRCTGGSCPKVECSTDGSKYRITGKNIPTDPYVAGEATVEISAEIIRPAVLQTALHGITGITLGDEIAGKITEDQAIRLINSVLAGLRQTRSARPTFDEQVTDASSDAFADLGLNKEQALTAMVQKRDERLADARQQIAALTQALEASTEEAYRNGYEAGRKAAGEL